MRPLQATLPFSAAGHGWPGGGAGLSTELGTASATGSWSSGSAPRRSRAWSSAGRRFPP
jgi:hypothetical protein